MFFIIFYGKEGKSQFTIPKHSLFTGNPFFCLNLAENVNKFMSGLLNAALQIVPYD